MPRNEEILLHGCLTPVVSLVPNQRDKSKRVLSIPMDETLIAALEAEADRLGINRVSLINDILWGEMAKLGRLPAREDTSGR